LQRRIAPKAVAQRRCGNSAVTDLKHPVLHHPAGADQPDRRAPRLTTWDSRCRSRLTRSSTCGDVTRPPRDVITVGSYRRREGRCAFSARTLSGAARGWPAYVGRVIWAPASKPATGSRGAMFDHHDVEMGSGLSSSAALECAAPARARRPRCAPPTESQARPPSAPKTTMSATPTGLLDNWHRCCPPGDGPACHCRDLIPSRLWPLPDAHGVALLLIDFPAAIVTPAATMRPPRGVRERGGRSHRVVSARVPDRGPPRLSPAGYRPGRRSSGPPHVLTENNRVLALVACAG